MSGTIPKKVRGKEVYLRGINIQWPWSKLIVAGDKTVETRNYHLPKKFINMPLLLIETPGRDGRNLGQIDRARGIAVIVFSESKKYKSKKEWLNEFKYHRVNENDPNYAYKPQHGKFGWTIKRIFLLNKHVTVPSRRGFVFTGPIKIDYADLESSSELDDL